MNKQKEEHSWRIGDWIPFICILFVYITGMQVDVMEIDSAQYAHISRTLAAGGSWLEFFDLGRPYLDKPPLTFWLSAISFKILGVSNFTFRLPSVCFSFLAVFSLYKAIRLWKSHRAAWFAALILSSCQAFFLMNLDVKTDMFLIGGIMFSVWQMSEFLFNPQWKYAMGIGLGLGLSLLAKGPIGFVIPVFAVGTHIIIQNKWKALVDIKLVLAALMIFLCLFPMSIGLYSQFGKEGIDFFFWTQSFGRITGESEWKNDAGPFFLVQTFGWAFLPWTGLFLLALISKIKTAAADFRFSVPAIEWISLAGFLFGFIILTMSRFKLPHYIFVVTPFAAWIAGEWLCDLEKGIKKMANVFIWIQAFVLIICTIVPVFLLFYCFHSQDLYPWIGFLGITLVITISVGLAHEKAGKIALITTMVATGGNFILNSGAYPQLLKYQVNSNIVKVLSENEIPENRFRVLLKGGHSTAFYLKANTIPALMDIGQTAPFLLEGPGYILTTEKGLGELRDFGVEFEIVNELPDFRVGRLSILFLNPETRDAAVSKTFLVFAKTIHPKP